MVIASTFRVIIHHVLYVPTLNESLFSTIQHVENPGCAELSVNKSTYLMFPNQAVQECMDSSIKLFITPGKNSSLPISFEAIKKAPLFGPRTTPESHRVMTRSGEVVTTTPVPPLTTSESSPVRGVPPEVSPQSSSLASSPETPQTIPLRPVYKVSSTVPNIVSFTTDFLRHCVGFQSAEHLIPLLKSVPVHQLTSP